MNKKPVFLGVFAALGLMWWPQVDARVVSAEAVASSASDARRQALSELAQSLYVQVKAETSSTVRSDGRSEGVSSLKTSTDLPLMGVEVVCDSQGAMSRCQAQLSRNSSLPAYAQQWKKVQAQFSELNGLLQRAQPLDQHMLLTQMRTALLQMDQIELVIAALGESSAARSQAMTLAEVDAKLRQQESAVLSMEVAAQLVAQSLKDGDVYIHPPIPMGSHEVTPFGRHMRDLLASRLSTVESPERAQSQLKAEYELGPTGMRLAFRQVDPSGTVLVTRLLSLQASAYKAWPAKPQTLDFDRLLHEGLVVGGDFKAQLATSKGSNSLLFQRGETIEVLVKLNKPGHFYAVGHVVQGARSYSYLLELGTGQMGRRFVQYVNADDVNKWISLGQFEASAPFGVESLQLIASQDDPVSRLPQYQLDVKSGFYRLMGNAKQGVLQTRALKPKAQAASAPYQAESVLMFTTMDK